MEGGNVKRWRIDPRYFVHFYKYLISVSLEVITLYDVYIENNVIPTYLPKCWVSRDELAQYSFDSMQVDNAKILKMKIYLHDIVVDAFESICKINLSFV